MADLSITAASVAAGSNAQVNRAFNAGTTVTAGQIVYLDSNQLWQLAKADTLIHSGNATQWGIALHGSLSGQPLAVQLNGQITIGATVTTGVAYYVSAANGGGIAPVGDLSSGNYVSLLGYAINTTTLQLLPTPFGVHL